MANVRAPGMVDVARLAGVSHQTVSRVLNDHPRVAAATRERVQLAIAELGYRRNSAARALVSGRSGTVGVVTPSSALFGPVSTLLAIEEAARAAGLYISLASLRVSDAASMKAALDHFLDQAVEAIVVIAPQAEVATAAEAIATRVPVVMVAADHAGPGGLFHSASVDQEAGARLAVRHLLDLGHASVAHLAGPLDWFDGAARVRGWKAELRSAGLRVGRPAIGDWSAERGYQVGLELIRSDPPSAIFVANDLMALGLIRALHDAGIRVPQDMSVAGFDDVDGADNFLPPLTTVRQNFAALGRQCVDLLLAALGGTPHDAPPIAPELIVRQSTAPPR